MRLTDEELGQFRGKKKKRVPFAFVIDALSCVDLVTKPMFGCLAIYVEGKIVLILRDRETSPEDNGVWIATQKEHHASLLGEFSQMRSLQLFGKGPTHWQLIPKESLDFEEAALRACELVIAGDPRIGRSPKPRAKRRASISKTKGPKRR